MLRNTLFGFLGTAIAETLIFEDNFDTLDFSKWQHEITLSGGGNWEFEWYVNNRTNSFVQDSVLHIQPTLTHDVLGDEMVTGDVNIWGGKFTNECTSNAFYGCERNAAASGNVINPVRSARLRTAGKFSFKQGKVEVRAQLPKGDFLWPAIWMLPNDETYGQWPASGEIDIMESRGNDASCQAGGRNKFASTLHWGPDWASNKYELTTEQYTHDSDLSDDFHIYGLIWTNDRITTYIDDPSKVVLDVDLSTESFWEKSGFDAEGRDNPWVNEDNIAPFNREFYIILNVAAGGTNGYFPDGQCGKTWSDMDQHSVNAFWNSWGAWYPTWEYPDTHNAAMKVDYVKVWSLDGDKFTPVQ